MPQHITHSVDNDLVKLGYALCIHVSRLPAPAPRRAGLVNANKVANASDQKPCGPYAVALLEFPYSHLYRTSPTPAVPFAPPPPPPLPPSGTPTPRFRLLTPAFFLLGVGTSTCAPPFSPPPPICTSSPSALPPYNSCHRLDSSNSFISAGRSRSHFILGPVFERSLTRKP